MTRPNAREILNAFAAVMSREEWEKMVTNYIECRKAQEKRT